MSQVRHRASTKARALVHAEIGSGPREIQRLLAGEGVDPVPSVNTIWTWCNPKKASLQAQRDLAVARRWRLGHASFAWPGVRGPEWKLARMRVLDGAGVSAAAIARVMAVDFPKDNRLTEAQVRRALHTGRPPRSTRDGGRR